MTTNTINSQAASIEHDDKFNDLLSANEAAATDAHICGGDFGTQKTLITAYRALVDYIDAKLAQAQADADFRYKELAEFHEHTLNKLQESESRLAEIQRGVEGLRTYFIAAYSHPAYDPKFVALQDVLAILAPQGQPIGCTHNCNQGRDCTCDTSGLPG